MAKSYHHDILKIVKRWKKAQLHEVTTSANVGAYPVPLGQMSRTYWSQDLPPGVLKVADYFRRKKKR